MSGKSYFKMGIFTWKQKSNYCNDFGNYSVLIIPLELFCHGQFVSRNVPLELVISGSLCLISKNLGSGTLKEAPHGPRPWPTKVNEGEILAVCLPWDTVATPLLSGLAELDKKYCDFLFVAFWSSSKISIKNQQDFIIFNYFLFYVKSKILPVFELAP